MFSQAQPSSAQAGAEVYRPSFGADGQGVPFNSFLSTIPTGTKIFDDVSFDTNSKDPAMVRSRVFIGNLLPGVASREDIIGLCREVGTVLAATLFKGFAFVQFSNSEEADATVAGFHQKTWKGCKLDVRLAVNPKQDKKDDERLRKRRAEDASFVDELTAQNDKNRRMATNDRSTNDDLADTSMADTLICGGCRFVTCDFDIWKRHRIAGCAKPKDLREPDVLKCASCEQRFQSAWGLIVHLTDFHRMMLYRAEAAAPQVSSVAATNPSTPVAPPTDVVSEENGSQ